MGNLALIMCAPEEKKESGRFGIVENLINRIKGVFVKKNLNEFIRRFEISENLGLYLVTAPVTECELLKFNAHKAAKLNSFIEKINQENGISNYIFSEQFKKIEGLNGFGRNKLANKILFSSLLMNILDEIYSKRGILVNALDITIITGDNMQDLRNYTTMLLPYLKYLTIITDEKESVESYANQVCDDTGLSIRVTSDYKGGMEKSDLIINLGHIDTNKIKSRVKTKAVVINYGVIDNYNIFDSSIVINGVESDIPLFITSKLDKNIFNCFNKNEIAGIILICSLNYENIIERNDIGIKIMEHISQEFRRNGFIITGFVGRHGVLRLREISINRAV